MLIDIVMLLYVIFAIDSHNSLHYIHVVVAIFVLVHPISERSGVVFFLLPSECSKNIIAPTPVVFVVAHTAVVLYLVNYIW